MRITPHDREELVLQGTVPAQFFHRALIRPPTIGDDPCVGAQLVTQDQAMLEGFTVSPKDASVIRLVVDAYIEGARRHLEALQMPRQPMG